MRLNLLITAIFSLLFLLASPGLAQNCGSIITENKNIGGTQILKSKQQMMVVRGTYSYSLEFINTEKGVLANVYSKSGVEFNQDDEIIFMDKNKTRKSYRFIEMGELIRRGGTPVHQNVLQLDLAALNWFSTALMNTIYIKNNISNKMFKFTVNPNRQAEFKHLATCFNNSLDKTKVRDTKLVGNDFSPTNGNVSNTGKNSSI